MELRGINRIVVAVNNLEEAKKTYSEAFGATFRQANWTGEAFGIEVAISWDAGIELCAPIKGCEDTSAVSAFLANNGEGVMSVILGVEDALKAKHKAESAGVLAFHSVDYTQEEINSHLDGMFEKYQEFFLNSTSQFGFSIAVAQIDPK